MADVERRADAATCSGSKPDVSIAASHARPFSADDVGAVADHVLGAGNSSPVEPAREQRDLVAARERRRDHVAAEEDGPAEDEERMTRNIAVARSTAGRAPARP